MQLVHSSQNQRVVESHNRKVNFVLFGKVDYFVNILSGYFGDAYSVACDAAVAWDSKDI